MDGCFARYTLVVLWRGGRMTSWCIRQDKDSEYTVRFVPTACSWSSVISCTYLQVVYVLV